MVVRTEIWSSGGGVQSTAIAALICQGELNPDLAVIVDTEREARTTWEYLDTWVLPALNKAGCILHRVTKSQYATVDLFGGKDKGDVLLPAFTDQSGRIGKLATYCSNEWKKRVMQRWAREQGVTQANTWIGFTIDELNRVTTPIGKWQHRYPLIERRMTRGDCIALVESMGWPTPPRSSCWMCPNHTTSEWVDLKENNPEDFKLAVQLEKEIRLIDESIYLSNSGVTLDKTDFTNPQDDLFTGRCTSGMCFV